MNLKAYEQVLSTGEVKIHVVPLPHGVYGFAYYSRNCRYHIFISESLSPLAKQEVLFHEIHHIIIDMPKHIYYLGLNLQNKEFEVKATSIARKVHKKTQLKCEGDE